MVRIDRSGTEKFVQPHTLDKAACKAAIDTLVNGTGAGNDFTGWVNLPVDYDKEEFARIQKAAEKIKANSKALVVIGIGGSYLGARAVIELLKSPNYNALPKDTPDVYFLGNGISSDALTDVVTMLGDRDFSVAEHRDHVGHDARRPRFLGERHLEVRHHHGAGHRLPHFQGNAGEEVRQGGCA